VETTAQHPPTAPSALIDWNLPDDHLAVRFPDATLSRADLFGAASAVAERVAGHRMVALEATATAQTVTAVAGCLLAGVPVVPIPPDSGPAEREYILRDSGAELVLGTDDVDLTARSDRSFTEAPSAATAIVLYTSGTTGPAKGVLLSRGAVAAGLDALTEAWDWTPDDTVAHGLPLFHVHGLILGVLGPLRTGGRVVHTGRPTPAGYAQAAAQQGATMLFGVPTVWSRMCAAPDAARELRGSRLLVSGSAALPASVFEQLRTLTGQSPIERYGMTETLITLSTRPSGPRLPGTVGQPVPGTSVRLGEDDELQVRSGTLFSGYLDRPDATAAAYTSDGWLRTGDIATTGADGQYRIVGRASVDLIKSGGYRVGAGEVEDALLRHPLVREASVVGLPDDDLGQRITAFVVADGPTTDGSARLLIDHVAVHLSAHKRPRQVVFVETLPRNPMGKVVKAELIQQAP
jgi:fatty acid CoA ligase FadD36